MNHGCRDHASSYFVDQICTVAIAGLLGGGSLLLSWNGALDDMLVKPHDWLTVEGQIQFQQRGSGRFVPILKVDSMDNIRAIKPEPMLLLR